MNFSLSPARLVPLALALIVPFSAPVDARPSAQAAMRAQPWAAEALEAARHVPIQDGGRVKPLDTYARFSLLRLNGRMSMKTPQGERLSGIEWFLDTLFFPEASADYEVFLVQNDAVLDAVGLPHEGKRKRDRYALNELRPALPRLFELAREYGAIEEKERSSVEQQVYLLAGNVDFFLTVHGYLDFARHPFTVGGTELVELFEGRDEAPFSSVLTRVEAMVALYQRLNTDEDGEQVAAERQAVGSLLQHVSELTGGSGLLALFPPSGTVEESPVWVSPKDLLFAAAEGEAIDPAHVAVLQHLEAMALQRADPEAFTAQIVGLQGVIESLAEARGEYGKIGMEVGYYKAKLIDRSLYVFILAFLAMAFMWLRPRSKLLYAATSVGVLVPTVLLCIAIVVRCVIRGRPPVSTLYETVLFVTAVGSIVALIAEWINRHRLALSAAAILGMIGLFIANGYEMLDKRDTMPSLVAVLDTNFWLATHVTSITIGYSAGMLAALLASIYLIAKLLRLKREDRAFYRSLGRMVYGVLCFGLIFSVVGTILGGIWANDSWGRFWGWDPKENGALLIVLSQIMILHARNGGYLREHGVCMAAALGGTVVAFSWWGVNLLGVGLHSYGFTSGISQALWTYYGIQWSVVGLGGVAWLLERRHAEALQAAVVEERKGKGGMEGAPA